MSSGKSFLAAIVAVLTVIFSIVFYDRATSRSESEPKARTNPLSTTSTERIEPEVPDGHEIKQWNSVEDFNVNLVQFETVFWDPRDTISLRELIRESHLVKEASVLEIGCGSGLLGLCCLKSGASHVVATDVNRSAVANARFNAQWLALQNGFEARLVSLDQTGAFAVLQPDEKFDLIISNPPWVNRKPETIDEFALYDENFALMRSLFDGMKQHLNPGGRVWLAYGCVDAIKTMETLADERGFEFKILDDRELDELSEEFLPGMLVEVIPW